MRPNRSFATPAAALLLSAFAAFPALARQEADPADPRLTNESVEQELDRMARPRDPDAEPILPEDAEGEWSIPGLEEVDPPTGGPLIAEGVTVIDRDALLETSGPLPVVIFLPADGEPGLPPMPALPCSRLTEMQRVSESRPGDVRFRVNGRVYLFQERNYFLPMLYRVLSSEESPDAQDEEELARLREEAVDAGDVEALIEELESVRDATASADPEGEDEEADADGDADEGEEAPLLSEGTLIVSRRARVEPASAGGWVLRTDNDAEDDPGSDRPLRLMPSRNLESMIRILGDRGENVRFRVSGEVFVYDGANHLLPTLVVAERGMGDDLVTAQ